MSRLPNQAEDLDTLLRMRLSDDVRQQTALEILTGKPLATALRHARAQVKRDNQPSGWDSLDYAGDCMLSLVKRLAAPVTEEIERWRTAELSPALESELMGLSSGTAAIASAEDLTQRRIQQITKKRRDDITSGQGGLFDCEWVQS